MTNEDSQQLQAAMWDLVYGLLSDDERQALIARIKSDPDAARLYAKVRLEADLVAEAARVEDSSIALRPANAPPAAPLNRPTPAASPIAVSGPTKSKVELHRGGAWLAGAAATALAILLAVGLSWPRPNGPQLARSVVATDVVAPKSMPAGVTNSVTLRTYFVSASGEPLDATPSSLDFRLVNRAGQEQFHKAVRTNDIGQAKIEIPGEALQPGVRMEVAQSVPAGRDKDAELRDEAKPTRSETAAGGLPRIVADLPVQPEPQMAYFLLAEPTVNPARPVPFSLWNFAAFSAQPAPVEQAQAALESVKEVTIADSISQVDSQGAMVNGVLQRKQTSSMPATPTLDANHPSQSLAGVRLQRTAVAREALAEQDSPSAVPGAAANLRAAGRAGSLAQQAGAARQSSPKEGERIGTTPAGQPVEVVIPSDLQGKELLVAAICRGVTVATTSVTENKSRSSGMATRDARQVSENRLSLPLPPEADGWIEVALFDRQRSAAEPAYREYFYREPGRKLQIELPDLKPRFAPGEEVQLTLRITDENGRPAAGARVGARVWNEQLVQQSAEQPALLADAVRAGEVFGQASDPSDNKSQAATDTGSIEGQFPAITVQEPIELASNRQEVQATIQKITTAHESRRQRTMEVFGGTALFGGVAALLLLGMLLVLRMAASARVIGPVLVTALTSVVLGVGWLGWLPEAHFGHIAMAPAAASKTAPRNDEALKPIHERAGESVDALSAVNRPTAPLADGAAGGETLAGTEGKVRVELSEPAAAQPRPASLAVTEPAPGGGSLPRAETPLRALASQQEARAFSAGVPSPALGAAGPARPTGAIPGFQGRGDLSKAATAGDEPAVDAAAKKSLEDRLADKSEASPAPAALYFNPQLVTDASGATSVRFAMPTVPSEYRLLIDALGNGRIGSRQEILSCQPAGAK